MSLPAGRRKGHAGRVRFPDWHPGTGKSRGVVVLSFRCDGLRLGGEIAGAVVDFLGNELELVGLEVAELGRFGEEIFHGLGGEFVGLDGGVEEVKEVVGGG